MLSLNEKLTDEQRAVLKTLAFESVRYTVCHNSLLPIAAEEFSERLQQPCATFVTLRSNGKIRASAGVTTPVRPLILDIVHNAHQVCFQDFQRTTVKESELAHLTIDLSLLSEPQELHFKSEIELLKKIKPGIDGLILEDQLAHATFLPAMWGHLQTTEEFLSHLKIKAGLPPDYWSPQLRVFRYSTTTV